MTQIWSWLGNSICPGVAKWENKQTKTQKTKTKLPRYNHIFFFYKKSGLLVKVIDSGTKYKISLDHLVPESKEVLKEYGDLSKGLWSDLKEVLDAQILNNVSIKTLIMMNYYSVNKIGNLYKPVNKWKVWWRMCHSCSSNIPSIYYLLNIKIKRVTLYWRSPADTALTK